MVFVVAKISKTGFNREAITLSHAGLHTNELEYCTFYLFVTDTLMKDKIQRQQSSSSKWNIIYTYTYEYNITNKTDKNMVCMKTNNCSTTDVDHS